VKRINLLRILSCACLAIVFHAYVPFALSSEETRPAECPVGHIEANLENCCDSGCTFTASVSGWDPAIKPIIKWTVSAGGIRSGQGTWSIKIDTRGVRTKVVTVTLKVTGRGLPKACKVDEIYKAKTGCKGSRRHSAWQFLRTTEV